MHQPHDHLFRAVFAELQTAAPLLRLVAPRPLASAIDWSALATAPAALLDRELAAHDADLLFAAPLHGTPALLLLEHKSKQEPFAVLQALRYTVTLWQRWIDAESEPIHLPVVLAVVVHHDRRLWRAATTLRELLPPVATDSDPPLADFRLLLLDLASHSERDLLALDLPPAARLCLLHLAFVRWMSVREFGAAIVRWADVYRAIVATVGLGALAVFHSYALWVTDTPRTELAQWMTRILGDPAGDQVMSTAEKLIAAGRLEGRMEGRMEGRVEGRLEGRIQGRAELLLELLRKRFGAAADACSDRLLAAASTDLDRWAIRVLDAKSLEAVFAD